MAPERNRERPRGCGRRAPGAMERIRGLVLQGSPCWRTARTSRRPAPAARDAGATAVPNSQVDQQRVSSWRLPLNLTRLAFSIFGRVTVRTRS